MVHESSVSPPSGQSFLPSFRKVAKEGVPMGLERYVVDAVVLEGPEPQRDRPAPRHLQELAVSTPRALRRGRLRGPSAPLPATTLVFTSDPA